jgi:hypothetical protein
MGIISDIAEAVKESLNGATFSQSFNATRHYLPIYDLQDMKNLHVTVVPKGVVIQPGGRAHNQHDYQIDVAVQKKLSTGDNEEIDPLLTLVDEIADHFRFKRLDSFPNAMWVKTENAPVYAVEHLDRFRQFTSVVTLTFRMMR